MQIPQDASKEECIRLLNEVVVEYDNLMKLQLKTIHLLGRSIETMEKLQKSQEPFYQPVWEYFDWLDRD